MSTIDSIIRTRPNKLRKPRVYTVVSEDIARTVFNVQRSDFTDKFISVDDSVGRVQQIEALYVIAGEYAPFVLVAASAGVVNAFITTVLDDAAAGSKGVAVGNLHPVPLNLAHRTVVLHNRVQHGRESTSVTMNPYLKIADTSC